MKDVVYLKKELGHRAGRYVSIREFQSDKECESRITKNFVYLVHNADTIPQNLPKPRIDITKRIDTESQTEGFRFKVKGVVYMKQNRFIYRVDYCHSLFIRMVWKTHVLSSKGPVALA
ncbi:MAG: hypothetical protein HQL21_08165 [Candidatus Omnitrophica bacterium]|nr:hypothetical protein [Candidatus Omnitrophota bacterium]